MPAASADCYYRSNQLGIVGRHSRRCVAGVIDEGQKRIGKHTRTELGGDALEFRRLWPENMPFRLDPVTKRISAADEATLIDFNKHLIRRLHEKGFKFIDVGRDGRAVGSKFYEAELQVLRELGVL